MSKITKVKETVFVEGNYAPIYIMEDNSIRFPYVCRDNITRWGTEEIVKQEIKIQVIDSINKKGISDEIIEISASFENLFDELRDYILYKYIRIN